MKRSEQGAFRLNVLRVPRMVVQIRGTKHAVGAKQLLCANEFATPLRAKVDTHVVS